MGWINCDKLYDYNESGTSSTHLRFVSDSADISNIPIFVSLPELPSIMQVNSTTSGSLPTGESVKVIVLAVDTNQILNYFIDVFNVTSNLQVNINFTEVSEDDLMDILDGL